MSDQINSKDNKRLAKNTLFLYFRMFITLVVGLYTSRVVLNVLGVTDYGIYNVLGGIVAIFATLNSAMASTSSRYITYYLGRGDDNKLKQIFSTVSFVHLAIASIVILACETIGLWFFYHHMAIPTDRVNVAFWLLQFSFAASFLSMINIPYTGLIIAHENMNIYAYISIFDVVIKLLIVFLIQITPVDKLLSYGFLILLVQIMDFLIYRCYCVRKYVESHLMLFFDMSLFKELASYFGWSIFGNLAMVFNTQGINLLLNVFFGPAVNAARGVAVQVQNIINQFVGNFQVALNPQIVKTYANKEMERMHQLMFASAKYGFLLLFLLSLPVMIEAKYILQLWLGVVPDHTVNFLRIILMSCMVNSLANSSTVAAGATGKIKAYSIVVGGTVLLPLPIAYIMLKVVSFPEVVFCVVLTFEVLALYLRLLFMKKMVSMSIKKYACQVIIPALAVVVCSLIPPMLLHIYLTQSLINVIVVISFCFVMTLCSIYLVGLKKKEKVFVVNVVKNKVLHHLK